MRVVGGAAHSMHEGASLGRRPGGRSLPALGMHPVVLNEATALYGSCSRTETLLGCAMGRAEDVSQGRSRSAIERGRRGAPTRHTLTS